MSSSCVVATTPPSQFRIGSGVEYKVLGSATPKGKAIDCDGRLGDSCCDSSDGQSVRAQLYKDSDTNMNPNFYVKIARTKNWTQVYPSEDSESVCLFKSNNRDACVGLSQRTHCNDDSNCTWLETRNMCSAKQTDLHKDTDCLRKTTHGFDPTCGSHDHCATYPIDISMFDRIGCDQKSFRTLMGITSANGRCVDVCQDLGKLDCEKKGCVYTDANICVAEHDPICSSNVSKEDCDPKDCTWEANRTDTRLFYPFDATDATVSWSKKNHPGLCYLANHSLTPQAARDQLR